MSTRKSMRLNRRSFTALLAGSAVAAPAVLAQQNPPQPAPAAPPPRNGPRPEIPPFQAPIEFKRRETTPKVEPFPMAQVRLLPSVFTEAQEWNRAYMTRLPADRLLYNFRENAGLPFGSAQPFGGWEAKADGKRGTELRGHFTGHYLSASAQSAANGDKEAKAKGDELVAEMAKCQEKLGGGYLSAFPMELFDRLDRLSGVPRDPNPNAPVLPWAPFYTIHKILAGMIDMYQLAGNKQALKVAEGMAGWADDWTKSKTEEHTQQILRTEFGGMAESLYNLSAITLDDRWAAVGDRYTKKEFMNPLASRRDELRGLHVNTHIPQVIGAARRYEISSDTRFHDVADYFWYEVTSARAYVTGGTSNGESWQSQPRQLADELKRSVATAECCCAYNMMKLTRHLYTWTADPRYFDYYERVMFNHRIGTIQPQTGHTQYYLSLTPGTWKTFGTEDQSFWCCTGTGVEEYSKLNDSIYWKDDQGVYVNLFIPSELDWKEKGFKLRQETKFPQEPGTTLTVTADRPAQVAVRLRIPDWVASAPTVKINGRVLEATASGGSYLSITRSWKTGDRIEISLPMKLRVEAMADDPTLQAFLYGPIVLAGDLGSDGLTDAMQTGPNAPRIRQAPALEIPEFTEMGADPAIWIKPADKALSFRTNGQKTDVAMSPISSIFGRRYSVYWKVNGCTCG
jgi:DUF1680 family protein